MMRRWPIAVVVTIAATVTLAAVPQRQGAPAVKALVGGTLIDGFGGRSIRNSVILIEGERISAVGQLGSRRSAGRRSRGSSSSSRNRAWCCSSGPTAASR